MKLTVWMSLSRQNIVWQNHENINLSSTSKSGLFEHCSEDNENS